MKFNQVHGKNNHVFTHRPVRVGEKICFEIVKTGNRNIYFGFSAVDPGKLAHVLPMYSDGNPGLFMRKLDEKFCKEGSVIDYHFTSSGEVMYRVNGEEKGVLGSVGNKQSQLWRTMYLSSDVKIKHIDSS